MEINSAMQAAGASDAVLAQPAQAASQVSPQPARDGAIGLALGIVLGLGLAFLMEALDTRVGSVQEIERALELPLLARIPAPFGGRSGVPAAARPSRRIDRGAARVGGPLTESPADSEGSNGDRHQPPPTGVSLPHGSVSPRGNRGSRVRYRDRAKAGEVGRVQQSERVFEQKAPVEAPALAYWRRARRSLATLGEPNGREAEAYRVLKSSLDFVALEHHLKSILLTSGRDYYAKSTTITNLAVTLAQSGRRVLLCELDARRPGIGELFGLQGYPGFTEVVLGHATLDNVIVPVSASPSLVPAPSDELDPAIGGIGSVGAPVNNQLQGVLEVLPFGGMLPPTPGFLGSRAVAELVEALKLAPAEILLIDAPPLLAHGDALTLSGCVDGVILALPVPVRRPMLGELTRALSTSPRRPLGFITVGGDLPDSGHGVRPHDEIHQRPPSSSARGNGNASALYIAARD